MGAENKIILKHEVSVSDYIKESHLFGDIEIKTNTEANIINFSRVVLAASSPFLENCLKNLGEESQLIVTDCSFQTLLLAVEFLEHGNVETTQEIMEDVKEVLERLEIGDFDNSMDTKSEPIDLVTDVKIEPHEERIKFSPVSNSKKIEDDDCDEVDDIKDFVFENEVDLKNNDVDMDLKDDYLLEDPTDFDYTDTPKIIKSKKIKDIECQECNKKFSSQERLNNHKSKVHSGAIFKCEHCPRTFTKLGEKNCHENNHTRPFKCDQCDKTFGKNSTLQGHLR